MLGTVLSVAKGAVSWVTGLVDKALTWLTAVAIWWVARKDLEADQMEEELKGLKNVKQIRDRIANDPDARERLRQKYTRP